ncbi:MAG: PepSY domain-containing protein [Methylocystis sp.]|uniref:PepSY domain-containing protein n=1 Tax=Methylocystis sp. TaxID=1911079 RepID=UPI003DA50244
MTSAAFMLCSFLTLAVVAAGGGGAWAAEEEVERAEHTAQRGQCFSTAQTRERIEAHKLVDPFACMRSAAREHHGEPLGARLCRVEEQFLYEISLLRPDGRIVRLLFDAATGKPHSGHKDR